MGRIQSNIGLITGIPIADTVDQLIGVAGRPRDLLASRTEGLQSEQMAINMLSSRVLGFQFEVDKLDSATLFNARSVRSSDTSSLTAKVSEDASPEVANYRFTPVRTASTEQWISGRYESEATQVGEGTFTFRSGGFIDKGLSLDELNGGQGIDRGEIRLTDKSGATAIIDLKYAITTDDVIEAINSNTTVTIRATGVGDAFRLTDETGQSGTLSVREVGGGTTAASLGLAGLNAEGTATSVTGGDLLSLHDDTRLSLLNDSTGVRIRAAVDDLDITLADGTNLLVNLEGAKTLGALMDRLNAADPEKFSVAIHSDGDRLELTDHTTGSGTFTVASVAGGTTAQDLGLTGSASGGVITGRRLVAGLRTSLVSDLKGGQAGGELGVISITDRAGNSETVDLSGAETVDEILARINASDVGVAARINGARNGIVLEDTTGNTTGTLTVRSEDATGTAEWLGIAVGASVASVDSGTLDRRTVSEATRLASLNQGRGVELGDFKVTDSDGVTGAVDLNTLGSEAETVGDVIDRINALGIGVLARINDSGDGILLIDTAGGTNTLKVEQVGSASTAADLNILGTAVEVDLEGTSTQAIDGTETRTVSITAEETLADLVDAINALDAGVTASTVHDGQGVRMSLTADTGGAAGQLLIDQGGASLGLREFSKARDALLLYGDSQAGTSDILIRSSTNRFDQVIDGMELEIQSASESAVTLSVDSSDESLIDAVEGLVSSYNSLREEIDTQTDFDEDALTTGLLFGTNEALRVDTQLSRLLTDRYFGLGDIQSLEQLGLSLDDHGMLQFDKEKLKQAFADDPAAVQTFFTKEETGFVDKLDAAMDSLAGAQASLLTNRNKTLQATIDANQQRIERFNESLDRQRDRLLLQFYQLEQVIATLQQNQTALSSLRPIAPLGGSTN